MEERWEKRRAGEGKTEREKDDRGDKKERRREGGEGQGQFEDKMRAEER